MKRTIARLLAMLALATGLSTGSLANTGGYPLDTFPKDRVTDMAALQHGAKLFVNHCLNCHSAAYMRFNRLRDIGLSEDQIKKNLLFTSDKVGDLMTVSLAAKDAKEWFGAQPPDLTVIARSRAGNGGSGADYLYTYMRTFYRDPAKATGWNNLVFPDVGMPHVLWELQGEQRALFADEKDPHDPAKTVHVFKGFEQTQPGSLNKADYDVAVADLVAFLQWMGEPSQTQRARMGVWVLLFLAVFTVIAWRLNASYWKDIK